MRRTTTIGSISSGTLLTANLIESFTAELEYLTGDEPTPSEARIIAECNAWLAAEPESEEDEDVSGGDLLRELEDVLRELAPPYMYFGSHPGDGACFGFWLSEDFESEFDGLKVSDTSEVPADYCGEVLHINDHGNATLYAKDEGKAELREIWSVV